MSYRLVYVIGPSGAGKDSVLEGLRLGGMLNGSAHWAKRSITRASSAQGEQHEALEPNEFHVQCLNHAFAMHWSANGLHYGIRHRELDALKGDRWVFVNGSRAWLAQLLAAWPSATVVHIGAAPEVLAHRLSARGRETAEQVRARLAREVPMSLPGDCICIENNGSLQDAVISLVTALQARDAQCRRPGPGTSSRSGA